MPTCKNCGAEIEWASGMQHRRHADPPHLVHCIVDGKIADTVAEEA